MALAEFNGCEECALVQASRADRADPGGLTRSLACNILLRSILGRCEKLRIGRGCRGELNPRLPLLTTAPDHQMAGRWRLRDWSCRPVAEHGPQHL